MLTALQVKSIKEPGRYPDGKGLYLFVQKSGGRSWILRIQIKGKRRDFGLGSARDVTLAEARDLAAMMRKQALSGVDPVAVRRAASEPTASIPTFAHAAKRAHEERKAGWSNGKHQDQWLSSLENHAFARLGKLLPDQISAALIVETLLPIWQTAPETARRVRQRIFTVLNWAHSMGFRVAEAPQRAVEAAMPRQPKKDRHFAAMPYPSVGALFRKLEKDDTSGRLALRFLILTAARSGEVRGATWGEIDLKEKLWTIPADRMKARRQHVVPLSHPAIAILEVALSGRKRRNDAAEPVFPGMRGGQLSDMTLTKVLRGVTNEPATVHGFRSSFRDWAAEKTKYDGAVVEAALAHVNPNRVEAAYRRTAYLDKRTPLMRDWAKYLG